MWTLLAGAWQTLDPAHGVALAIPIWLAWLPLHWHEKALSGIWAGGWDALRCAVAFGRHGFPESGDLE